MNWDLTIFHAINGFAGNHVLDRLTMNVEWNHLVKGGVLAILFWYYWFQADKEQEARRQIIVCTVIGALLALAVNRTMASFLPFRVRPMYTAGIGFHPLSIVARSDLEEWSSFPSDNATFFFALTAGFYLLSRPLGLIVALYSAVIICLPRIYFGAHYPSDLLVGGAVGLGVAIPFNNGWTRRWVGRWILPLAERFPGWFYAIGFAVSYEIALVFDDMRDAVRGVVRMLRYFGWAMREDVAMFTIGLIGLAAIVGLWLRYRGQNRLSDRSPNAPAAENL